MTLGRSRKLRNQLKAIVRASQSNGPERFGTGIFRDGQPVYRHFDDPGHADALVRGEVWLSTLAVCRQLESARASRPALVVGGDPDFGGVARDGAQAGTIALEDAFVICTTAASQPAIEGRHCVEITLPHLFRLAVQARLAVLRYDFVRSEAGRVLYTDEAVSGPTEHGPTERSPNGLLKAPDAYRPLREIRMLYHVRNAAGLRPLLLDVPEVAGLCRRLS